VVKLLGDGALLLFLDADPCVSAVRAVTSIRDELIAIGLHPHAGVDVGPVVERDGDIFGRTVNHASRLASIATAGEVVVSEAVASALETHGIHPIEPLGEVTLKGIAVPVRAYLVATGRGSHR
jgi:class 3 adenylate cyclase